MSQWSAAFPMSWYPITPRSSLGLINDKPAHTATLSRTRTRSISRHCGSMHPHVQQPDTRPLDADSLPLEACHADLMPDCDWTQDLPQSAHVDLFRATDWARNGLGPFDSWSDTLRLFTGFVMADSRAACLWWGPGAVAIYNTHFAPMCASVHPTLMGSTYAEGFPELWPAIRGLFEESKRIGEGQNVSSNEPLLVERNGWREEAFFSGSFVPIGPAHQPLGF
jgi:hypothetical protein